MVKVKNYNNWLLKISYSIISRKINKLKRITVLGNLKLFYLFNSII